jgi:hypothetical protein
MDRFQEWKRPAHPPGPPRGDATLDQAMVSANPRGGGSACATHAAGGGERSLQLRVREQIMGPGKYGNGGKSQSGLIRISP